MHITVTLAARDVGTRATVTRRRFGFWTISRTYVCTGGDPIRGGQWADVDTGEEADAELERALNLAGRAAVIRKFAK
jgi:hypothetical protein